jgi:hypothetical protein
VTWTQLVDLLIWLGFGLVACKALEVIASAWTRSRQLIRKTDETRSGWLEAQNLLNDVRSEFLAEKLQSCDQFIDRIDALKQKQSDTSSPRAVFLNLIWLVATGSELTGLSEIEHFRASEDRQWFHRQGWKAVAAQCGLLGTIYGVILAFADLASGANPLDTLGAISIALYTTLVGLLIAIPIHLALMQIFKTRLDEFEAVVDAARSDLTQPTLEFCYRLDRHEMKRHVRQRPRAGRSGQAAIRRRRVQ